MYMFKFALHLSFIYLLWVLIGSLDCVSLVISQSDYFCFHLTALNSIENSNIALFQELFHVQSVTLHTTSVSSWFKRCQTMENRPHVLRWKTWVMQKTDLLLPKAICTYGHFHCNKKPCWLSLGHAHNNTVSQRDAFNLCMILLVCHMLMLNSFVQYLLTKFLFPIDDCTYMYDLLTNSNICSINMCLVLKECQCISRELLWFTVDIIKETILNS